MCDDIERKVQPLTLHTWLWSEPPCQTPALFVRFFRVSAGAALHIWPLGDNEARKDWCHGRERIQIFQQLCAGGDCAAGKLQDVPS